MMAALLEVLQPGLHTTLQDLGRLGHQDQGVPPSGALDMVGLRVANAMVGNPEGTACLEISYVGPTLRINASSARIAVSGDVKLTVKHGDSQRPLTSNRSHLLKKDEILVVGPINGASTAYLAVQGGFDFPPVLGSLSTYGRAGLGPLGGRPLSAGNHLPLCLDQARPGQDLALSAPLPYGDGPIRVVLGPQADAFTPEAVALFQSVQYRVSKDADRMGLRLDGPALRHVASADIPSDGLVNGCIQVPGNGQPIIVLADRQTVGGYAKIATVISADLPRLGRAMPGTILTFAAIPVDQAEAERRQLERTIKELIATMQPIVAVGIDLDALYGADLISGMVDAVSGWGK